MMKQAEVKAFKAVNKTTVIKRFLFDEKFPEGWFPSQREALEAFVDDIVQEAPRKAGRPKKAE